MSVRVNFMDIYLQGMHERSMQSGTGLACEIQPTDWSTAGEQGKLVFVVSTKAITGTIYFTFDNGEKIQISDHFKISVKNKC